MQIEFKKEQIVKDKPQSILIDYGEYKLQCPKWMVKNNTFIADDKYTYWVFNLENIKRELSGNELIKLLEPYIKDQKITVNKATAPKEYYLNDVKLEQLTFYEQHNSWFIGEITDNKTKITNPCFKYNWNGKDGVLNQALVENIGCFTETNIKQILKHMIGDRTYNIDMYTKMVNFKCYQINTAIQLL